VDDLVVIVLTGHGTKSSLKKIRTAGARTPADWRWRPLGRNFAAVIGTGVHAVMGTGRRAGRRADGRGAALLERTDSCAAGGQQTGARGNAWQKWA